MREMSPLSYLILVLLIPLSSAFPLTSSSGATVFHDAITEIPLPPLSLNPQEPNFDSFDLTSALPPASVIRAEAIDLPPNCAAYIGQGEDSECASAMTALSVQFEDCGDPFVVCRCDDAQMSIGSVLDRLGRVPVGLRRYAGTIVVVATNSTPHAYTLTTGDTHIFGDCSMNAWVHETIHAFDFAEDTRQSSAPGWSSALATDSCVPDSYSLVNAVEDFAQVGVITIYMLVYGGRLPPGFVADCMSNQLAFASSLAMYNPENLFGNTCNIVDGGPPARHTASPAVLDPSRTFPDVVSNGQISWRYEHYWGSGCGFDGARQ
ncbi:Conidiation-specific protein 13 [Mycena venus]|uniref:Conidiation-specific protein 13 n=1 Tax=Mycena venus TaxID=2733690 RepID=A0A8H6X6J0_9AGAR|nr:Conidiation-specific protein 13 [Mycena venus]